MLVGFFLQLRAAGIPVSLRELLDLLQALQARVMAPSMTEFYHLSRLCLVKDERLYDRFDQAFSACWHGSACSPAGDDTIDPDWFRDALSRQFSEEERARLQALGWDELMRTLAERLQEQDGPHHGGNKWIGSGGTSPFGHGGVHPEGIRIGGPSRGNRGAVKVWEARQYRDYDDQRELGTRQIQVALRRLRRFARLGARQELDLPDTIGATARNAGHLDLKMVAERRNHVKVLMLLDVGGSMDDHVLAVEDLFSAARSQFRHLDFYYFHNCVYGRVWRSNRMRHGDHVDTVDLLRRFPSDHKLILVGDATMSPYEILQPHGAIDHDNTEAGAVWLQRLLGHFADAAWINPESEGLWTYRQSIGVIRRLMGDRMYPLTVDGLTRAMHGLSRRRHTSTAI
jgi:uncharacterized protein with von Willebrand factor type A (vWA) domain